MRQNVVQTSVRQVRKTSSIRPLSILGGVFLAAGILFLARMWFLLGAHPFSIVSAVPMGVTVTGAILIAIGLSSR